MKTYIVHEDGTQLVLFNADNSEQYFTCIQSFPEHLRGKEVQEGKDFRFQHQINGAQYPDTSQYWQNSPEDVFNNVHPKYKRIICIPTEVRERCFCDIPFMNCHLHGTINLPESQPESKEETQEELTTLSTDEEALKKIISEIGTIVYAQSPISDDSFQLADIPSVMEKLEEIITRYFQIERARANYRTERTVNEDLADFSGYPTDGAKGTQERGLHKLLCNAYNDGMCDMNRGDELNPCHYESGTDYANKIIASLPQPTQVTTETAEGMVDNCNEWQGNPRRYNRDTVLKLMHGYASYRSLKDGELQEVGKEIEIKLDKSSLPKDGSLVEFKTDNEGWMTGYFSEGDKEYVFVKGTEDSGEPFFAWHSVISWKYK